MIHCTFVGRTFYNPANGYTVASYHTREELPSEVARQNRESPGVFQAYGMELPAGENLEVELDGTWKKGKYGFQLDVSYFHVNIPETEAGIEAYLSSDLIKGIGPVTAHRIVEKFGKRSLYVLDHTPEKLLGIPGISETKLEEILDGYQKSTALRELMVYLAPFGVTAKKLEKIQEHFGKSAYHIIQENPFRLCEVKGFGFLTVDAIAMKAKDFRPDDPLRIKAAITHVMQAAEEEGHLFLTCDEVVEKAELLLNKDKKNREVAERAIKDAGNEMIHQDQTLVGNGGGIYSRAAFEAETGAAGELIRLLSQKKEGKDITNLLKQILKEEQISLGKMQEKAVLQAFASPVSIITGGPGTGKTTLIRIILRIQERLDPDSMVMLCAPTGRARRRMYEKTGFPALTIQKAVGMTGADGEEAWNQPEKLPDDLIIADEFGMCDMYLADRFFHCIRQGASLVMIGDKDQLGSVGPGNVFKEMIESGVIPVTVLDACFRQEEGSTIVENARRINQNQTRLLYDETFRFFAASKPEDAAEIIQELYVKYWQEHGKRTDDIQVLSPFRKNTAAGSDALNERLREAVNSKRRGKAEIRNGKKLFRTGDVVMQTENKDEISNGDLGEVLGIYRKEKKTAMRVDFGDDRIVEFTDEDHWPLTHGYAMSVHKSQGNECAVVIIPVLDCFWRMLQRNILYTGITRATRQVILVGSRQAVAKAIRNNRMAKRNTNFALRLRQAYRSMQEMYKKSA